MKLTVFLLLSFLCVTIAAQSGGYEASLTNQCYIDSTGLSAPNQHNPNVELFSVYLHNVSGDTALYAGGQIYLQTLLRYFNLGNARLSLIKSDIPTTVLFSQTEVNIVGDTVQISCTGPKLQGKGKGYKIAPDASVLIAEFSLSTDSPSGFSDVAVPIVWRTIFTSDDPQTKLFMERQHKLVNVSQECSFTVRQ